MAPTAKERDAISLAGYTDLDGRPGFKMALQEVDGTWYMYVAHFWHSGWSVLDVTDPTDPELLTYIDGPENTLTLQVQVADGTMITSLEKPREGWGLADGPTMDPTDPHEEGAFIWDVESDPTDPELIGHYRTGGHGTHRNYYTGGRYAYMASVAEEYTGRLLEVVDVSDPTSPELASRWWWPGQGPDDEEDPTETYYFHGPAYVDGDRAYLSYGSVGAIILDVSDPTDPTFRSRLDVGDIGSWLGTHSAITIPDTDLMAVNGEAIYEGTPLEHDTGEPLNFVYLVDVSDDGPTGFDGQTFQGPRIVSSIPFPTPSNSVPYETYYERPGRFGPHNQHHYRGEDVRLKTNDYLIMTFFNAGLRIFDISNPLAPFEAGYYVPEDPDERIGTSRPASGLVSQLEDVVVDSRGYIYCTDPQQGLFVFESDLLDEE
ncbi:LVIVD repeat-containing protein [Saliphagus sp. GCM10025317]